MLSLLPIGPSHQPTHLKVQGLRDIADNIQRNLNETSHLELRVQLKYISYPEVAYDPADKEWNFKTQGSHLLHKSPKSDWIPTDFLPKELSLSLSHSTSLSPCHSERREESHSNSPVPVLIFLEIEFREVRANGKTKTLPNQAIIRLAAMHYDENTAQEIANLKPAPIPKPYQKPTKQTFDLQKAFKGLLQPTSKSHPPT